MVNFYYKQNNKDKKSDIKEYTVELWTFLYIILCLKFIIPVE